MNKIKTVKIKNEDGSVDKEAFYISADARNIDMTNGYNVQETIGTIDVDKDGSIAEQLNKKPYYYNTVADMKNADLQIGDYIITLGYYEINDGGGTEYNITNIQSDDEIQESLNNGLYANFIFYEKINLLQLGIKENNEISTIINNLFNNSKIKIIEIPKGNYTITNTILIPTSKELIGQFQNLSDTTTSSKIITEKNIIMIDCSTNNQITIRDLILEHPYTNTNPIIKLSQSRYINLKNILIKHNTTNICNAKAITDYDTTGWSGYITLDNVRASYYNNPLYFKATFIKIMNCTLQHAATYAIWLAGEGIGGIDKTDISKSSGDNFIACIRYDGHYGVNITNCYLENYFIEEVVENTNNVPINIVGCKIYERGTGTNTSGVMTFSTEKYPQNKRNIANSFINGYASVNNMLANGDFKDSFNWTKINNYQVIEYLTKTEMTALNIGLPQYYTKCCHKSGISGGVYQKITEHFNAGDIITLGFWLYIPTTNTTRGYIYLTDAWSGTAHSIIELRPEKKVGEWVYYQASSAITAETADKDLYVKLLYGDNQEFYITGISVCRGYGSVIDCNYTPNKEKIITDKLILKGSNNKYYNISFDGTNFNANEVLNFD